MRKENMLTEGPILKGLALFALPILVGQIFQQLYNTADAMIVGQFLSDQEYAAVSSSGSLVFLLIGFFAGISMGAGVVIARYFGAKDWERLHVAIHTTVAFGLIAGVALTAIGMVLTPQILRLMSTPESVMQYSVQYFRMYFAGALGISLYNLLRGILQAVGDSKHPLYYLIFSSLINIGLDLLFIGVFHWGVWAAALATSISQCFSAMLCLIRLMREREEYRVELREIRLERAMFLEVLRNGVPAGVQNSIIAFANVVVQSNINSFGAVAVAGCGTYSKLEGFAFLPITCITMALTTFVSQNLGAGRQVRVRKATRVGILTAITMAELIGLSILTFGPTLMRLFTDNPDSIAVGMQQVHVEVLFYFALAFTHSIASILRGAGMPMVPMFVMLGVWCVLRVTYISIMVPIFRDIRVVFTAYPLTWSISSIIFLIIFLKTDWINNYKRKAERAEQAQ